MKQWNPFHPRTAAGQAGYALASALLIVLAAPPFDLWPLAFVCLIPVYLAIKQAAFPKAVFLGWLMGFFMLLGGTHWWIPLLGRFAGLTFLQGAGVTFLLCAYQALAYALWAGVSNLAARRYKISWLVAGPLLLGLSEMLVPFPFKMYLAITLWKVWPLTQVAELGGPPAVSALLALLNILLAEVLIDVRAKEWSRLQRLFPAALAVAGIFLFSLIRIWQVGAALDAAPGLRVGLVQPNFGLVSIKEREHHGKKYIKALRAATSELEKQKAGLIVWPETAWPYLFDRLVPREYPAGHPWALRNNTGSPLLFGALTHVFGSQGVFNSALLVGKDGEIKGRYDKNGLVPFAEYIPFASRFPDWAEKVRQRTPDWPEIEKGRGSSVVVDGGLRLGTMICSEDLDAEYVHEMARDKPNLLATIASDAWFGDSGGAEQHLALASFRAIEMRRDFVRSANTGISAVIDALGRVRRQGPLYEVTGKAARPPTLLTEKVRLLNIPALAPHVARFFPLFCLLGLIAALFVAGRRS